MLNAGGELDFLRKFSEATAVATLAYCFIYGVRFLLPRLIETYKLEAKHRHELYTTSVAAIKELTSEVHCMNDNLGEAIGAMSKIQTRSIDALTLVVKHLEKK